MVEKKQILDTAINTFGALGIKRVSIDDLCFNLAISKKTFYQHYSEKHALIDDFLEAEFAVIFGEYTRLNNTAQSPLEVMVRYNQFLMDRIQSRNPAVLYDLKQFYPRNWEVYHRLRSGLVERFAAILTEGMASGHFRKEID